MAEMEECNGADLSQNQQPRLLGNMPRKPARASLEKYSGLY
jgi:hypothetical protein